MVTVQGGQRLWLWGRPVALEVAPSPGRTRVKFDEQAGRLQVWLRKGAGMADLKKVLEAWYRARLREVLPELIARWQARLGVQVYHFALRRVRGYWGKCEPGWNALTFNSEIARLPGELLEYVVVHELCHLREMNHGPRFWALLDEYAGGRARQLDREMRQFGKSLR